MAVRSNSKSKYICFVILVSLCGAGILFLTEVKTRLLGIIFVSAGCFISLRYYISVSREFIFDDNGISIRWRNKRFSFAWGDVVCYHYRSDSKVTFSRPQYMETMVFVPKRIHYFNMQPLLYCIFFHPFDVAFVNLGKSNSAAPDIYQTETIRFEEFLNHLNIPILSTFNEHRGRFSVLPKKK